MSEETPKIGVYVCDCGTNIGAVVDVPAVVSFASELPSVAVAREYKYVCSEPGQELIQQDIQAFGINRVVVASCTPRMHEPTFQHALAEAGLNPYCLQMTNIREHASWISKDEKAATDKANRLVRAAVARVALHEPLEPRTEKVTRAGVIVAGGIAGIQAALTRADGGYKVYLVEREPTIGGHMAQLDKTFPTLDCST